jgi:ribosome biogenesis GTPase
MKQGQVFKIHSDFYYVESGGNVFECKVREVLKKRGEKILTGDIVEFADGVIERILPRKNFIARPACANIDQVIIVSALDKPDLTQFDRYIAFARYYEVPVQLCFNKDDLVSGKWKVENGKLDNELSTFNFQLSTYKTLGYDAAITSVTERTGLEEFTALLEGKTSVLCGASGVGKSSLINALNSEFNLKIGAVSEKTGRGTHTTRHCEIITIKPGTKIIDTPGFSNLKFDFLLPQEISGLFEEFPRGKCKFSDCLHLNETGCAVRGYVSESRYNSYVTFVEEARAYKRAKTEAATKFIGNRVAGRNTLKQKINQEID